MKKGHCRFRLVVIILLLIFLPVWYFSNFTLSQSTYSLSFSNKSADVVPSGLKIAQLSDFHNCRNKRMQNMILTALAEEKPDLIAVTGDFMDSFHPDLNVALAFAEKLVQLAPVYYVPGNHEAMLRLKNDFYGRLCSGMEKAGVHLLLNTGCVIYYKGVSFNLYGLTDPLFLTTGGNNEKDRTTSACHTLSVNPAQFNILLAHRPELIGVYADAGFDLVLSGHAHGGQVRLFGQGLYAPNQGIFPKYTSGVYRVKSMNEVISRGLWGSLQLRIFDRPELVFAVLK